MSLCKDGLSLIGGSIETYSNNNRLFYQRQYISRSIHYLILFGANDNYMVNIFRSIYLVRLTWDLLIVEGDLNLVGDGLLWGVGDQTLATS